MKQNQHIDLERTRVDWRGTIKSNTRKTYMVMFLFFLTYTLFGCILDLLLWVPSTYVSFNATNHSQQQPMSAMVAYMAAYLAECIRGEHVPVIVFALQFVAIGAIVWTRFRHKSIMLMGTKFSQVTEATTDPKAQQALNILNELKIAASMDYVPQFYVIDSPTMNAFASGWDEKNSMIAITKPLLMGLNREELQAVLAHELSHIRHQDIKLTLTVTVLSNIMLIIVDAMFRNALYGRNANRRGGRSNRDGNFIAILVVTVLHIVVPLISAVLIMYLSRTREYLADAGAIALVRNNVGLAQALLKIQNNHLDNQKQEMAYDESTPHEKLRYESYIYWPNTKQTSRFFGRLFSTHPAIADRLAAIGFKQRND